jgi:hypothetical protein
MTLNCKPGDLARMVECGIQEAVGLIVEVVSDCSFRHPQSVAWFGPMWRCKAVSGAPSDKGYALPGEWCAIPDAWLRPIRPDGLDDDTPTTEDAGLRVHERECAA